MNTVFIRYFWILIGLLIYQSLIAQPEQAADFMRNTGMIYVVVAVLTLIFLGIVLYLWQLDRKLRNMERIMENEITLHKESQEI